MLTVVHLIFTQGYTTPENSQLRDEAIRLSKLVASLMPDEPEALGLVALLLLHDSRAAARHSETGDVVLLEEQDRSRRNRAEIVEAVTLLDRALRRGKPGPFQLQAAIAALHSQAASTDQTNWSHIAALYAQLLTFTASPVVALNHAVAVAMATTPTDGLALIDQSKVWSATTCCMPRGQTCSAGSAVQRRLLRHIVAHLNWPPTPQTAGSSPAVCCPSTIRSPHETVHSRPGPPAAGPPVSHHDRRIAHVDSPDIVKMLLYRPDFLARPLLALTAHAMRGPSFWTAGEREYLAMSTAQVHQCPFCHVTHTELTRLAAHGEIDPDDPSSARPELQAIRQFLDTITRTPDNTDARAIAGLTEQAVLEALHVNLVWNIINRLANAFGFQLREGQLETGTRSLHRFGYRFPAFLLAGGTRPDRGGLVDDLRHAVLDVPARTSPALRRAAATGESLDNSWQIYADGVRDHSYRLADADIDRLTAAGHSEDEIFEVTVAAAVGAALRSFDAGRRTIRHTP